MFGPSRIPHSCGHVVSWTCGEGDAGTWLLFVQTMYGLPCPWCGGEGGVPASDETDEVIFHYCPPGLWTLTASRREL